MPSGRHKSGSLRKVQDKVPGGRTVQKYLKRSPSIAKCGSCKKALHGIPRGRPTEMTHMPKTMKRPERPYGGTLCSACTRKRIKLETR